MLEVKARQEIVANKLVSGSAHIKRYISRRTAGAEETADVYQESITRVLEQARERPIDHPIAYAMRVARNLIIGKPEQPEALDEEFACPQPSPEERTAHAQRVAKLQLFLENMPPMRRSVFVRRRIHGESRDAIARALEISPEAVKKHMTRALADLQRFIDKEQDKEADQRHG